MCALFSNAYQVFHSIILGFISIAKVLRVVVSGICSEEETIDVFAIVEHFMHEDAGGRVGWVRVGLGTIGRCVGLGGAANLIHEHVVVVPSLVVAIAELDHDILAAGDGTELGALERTVEGVACGKHF